MPEMPSGYTHQLCVRKAAFGRGRASLTVSSASAIRQFPVSDIFLAPHAWDLQLREMSLPELELELELKEAVIHQPWGGLGDNLSLSTLPEMFAARGIRTLISTRNAVRNSEINSLVWELNPFVCGVSDAEPNAGACRNTILDTIPKSLNFIERIECAHSLEPANRLPKVYYEPKPRAELSDAVIVDVGSTAVAAPPAALADYLDYVFANYGYRSDEALQVRFTSKVAAKNTYRIERLEPLTIGSIFEYCDVIASCRAFVTVHSGAQTLAAALRSNHTRPFINCFCTIQQYNSRTYLWDNVEYYVGRKSSPAVASLRRSWRILQRKWRK
jgi:hypothetical protein